MKEIKFTWDENKNQINKDKHKLSFEEAKTVFYDMEAIVFDDPEHSQEEERFLILGFSEKARLCIVSHCYRENDEVIRIISARRATKNEENYYNEENGGG
ncbi:MAG: BrnT family toxin [Lachnospiraceae bacterium]|nr:BrnT family toxin [Lachnospiraceae bacterium]